MKKRLIIFSSILFILCAGCLAAAGDIKTESLVVNAEVPEDYVYLMTKTMFESTAALEEVYKGMSFCTPENCVNFNIPLHTGVIRYLEEVGVEVPEALIPPEYAG